MLLSFFCFVAMLFLFGFSLALFNNEIFSPPVLFIGGFSLSLLNGLSNFNSWNFRLHANTVFLICGSSLLFLCLSYFVHVVFSKGKDSTGVISKGYIQKRGNICSPIIVPSWLGIFGLGFTLLAFVMMAAAIKRVLSPWGAGNNVLDNANLYNEVSKLSATDVSIGGIPGTVFGFAQAMFYVWIYIMIHDYVRCKHNFNAWAFVNLLATIPLALITGARTDLLLMTTAALTMYFLLVREGRSPLSVKNIKLIYIFWISIIMLFVFLVFYLLVPLLGRDIGTLTLYQYISIYLGAPIKNLDSYLNGNLVYPVTVSSSEWGQATFFSIRESFDHLINIPVTRNLLEMQPFQRVDSSYDSASLGNVYTTLYPFVFDWGFWGAFVVVGVLAVISQLFFEHAQVRIRKEKSSINFSLLVYTFFAYGLLFSFFSNRLVNQIVSISFIRKIIIWIIVSAILTQTQKRETRFSKNHVL